MRNNVRNRVTGWALVSATAFLVCGCSPQQQANANSQAEKVNAQAKQAAQNAKEELTDQGIALKVKTAMGTSDKLNTSGIKTIVKDKVVTLEGAAADANQKALAERITKDTVGPDVKVVSRLAVMPAVPSTVNGSNPPGPHK